MKQHAQQICLLEQNRSLLQNEPHFREHRELGIWDHELQKKEFLFHWLRSLTDQHQRERGEEMGGYLWDSEPWVSFQFKSFQIASICNRTGANFKALVILDRTCLLSDQTLPTHQHKCSGFSDNRGDKSGYWGWVAMNPTQSFDGRVLTQSTQCCVIFCNPTQPT